MLWWKIATLQLFVQGLMWHEPSVVAACCPSLLSPPHTFVQERKVSLMEWINKLLASEFATNYHMNSFLEAVDDDVLHQGETLPSATWVDVEDKELKTDDIPKDQAVIIAAASYWTYQALTAFLDPACEATMKKYPTIKQYNVGLSELRLVPSAVRGQVKHSP